MSPTALTIDPTRVGELVTSVSTDAASVTTASVRIIAEFSAATAGRKFTAWGASLRDNLHQRRGDLEELARAVQAAADGVAAQLSAHRETDESTAAALARSDQGA